MPKPEFEKNSKIDTRSNPFLNYRKFCQKKMHFGQILVKLSSQTRKLENSTSFEPIFLPPKNSNSKNFGILIPEKTQTLTQKVQLNSNPKKSKLDQALLLTLYW